MRLPVPVLVAAALALLAAGPAHADAVAYQGDATHAGFVDATLQPPLGRKWVRRDLGRLSYPVIAAEKVFVTDGAVLHALDRRTGLTVWSRPVDVESRVAFGHGRLFVTGSKTLTAVDPGDGATIWSVPAETFTVTVAGDLVVATTEDGLTARRWQDGLEIWDGAAAGAEDAVPAYDGDRVYSVSYCGAAAWEASLGARIWDYSGDDCGSGFFDSQPPIVHGDNLYLSKAGWAVLDTFLGTLEGEIEAGRMAIAHGHAYDARGPLRALDLSRGTVEWQVNLPEGQRFATPPLVVGDVVYAHTDRMRLYAVDRASGRVLWSREHSLADFAERSDARDTGMAADEGLLVVGSNERLVGFGPGPDSPGVDDPDKTPASAVAFDLDAYPRSVHYGQLVRLAVRLERGYGRRVELQESRFPYRRWRTVKRRRIDSFHDFYVRPKINTRYRVVDPDTLPPKRSRVRRVFLEIDGRIRYYRHRGGGVRVAGWFRVPPALRLHKRRVHIYRFRTRGSRGRHVGTVGIRRARRPGRYRVAGVVRPRRMRSNDLFSACIPKFPPRGYGRDARPVTGCGRRRA